MTKTALAIAVVSLSAVFSANVCCHTVQAQVLMKGHPPVESAPPIMSTEEQIRHQRIFVAELQRRMAEKERPFNEQLETLKQELEVKSQDFEARIAALDAEYQQARAECLAQEEKFIARRNADMAPLVRRDKEVIERWRIAASERSTELRKTQREIDELRSRGVQDDSPELATALAKANSLDAELVKIGAPFDAERDAIEAEMKAQRASVAPERAVLWQNRLAAYALSDQAINLRGEFDNVKALYAKQQIDIEDLRQAAVGDLWLRLASADAQLVSLELRLKTEQYMNGKQ